MTHEEIESEINTLISEYQFPLVVLQDVHKRLNDCRDVHYAAQQLLYLKNIVSAGMVERRVDE